MGATIEPGSHIKHAIAHSLALTGQVIGAAIGAVIGGLIVAGVAIFTAGIGLVASAAIIVAAIGLGAAIGKWLGGKSTGHRSGEIKRGSPTIFYGRGGKAAARLMDPLKCEDPMVSLAEDVANSPVGLMSPALVVGVALGVHELLGAHPDAFIGSGVKHILYDEDFLLASRLKDKTSCGGSVDEGLDTILLCGETFYVMDPALMTEDSAAMWWFLFGLDVLSLALGVGEAKLTLKLLPILFPWVLKGLGMAANAAGYPRLAAAIGVLEQIAGYAGGSRTRADKGVLGAQLISAALGWPDGTEEPVSSEDAAYRRQVMRRTGASKSWYQTQYQLPAR